MKSKVSLNEGIGQLNVDLILLDLVLTEHPRTEQGFRANWIVILLANKLTVPGLISGLSDHQHRRSCVL